ncbi:alpha-1,2-mannosyltransferase [Exophiala viscosa]|uniref:alpha-1,2-mannosyltransferase n=1 Tax=Exophiala viscosa TaxID=2486360 RepID=UPI002198666D|nr:alpha-1,2-mannosyltransferase [Exophiala viscosa]
MVMETVLSLAKLQETSAKDLILSWQPWAILLLCSFLPTRLFLYGRRPCKAGVQPVESKPSQKPASAEQKPDWNTITFQHITPKDHDFDWTQTPEQPYRPWYNGPHHVTMGIKRTSLEEWVEIDHKYLERYSYKRHLFSTYPEKTIQCLPGSEEASFEALYLLADLLPRRYPSMFQATSTGISNLVTGDTWDLRRESSIWNDYHPLQVMGLLTTEDWFIMQPDEQDPSVTRLRAGANCFPAGWKIQERIGHSLWEIHAGKVPMYEEKLALSMDRFFQKQRVNSPVMRFNYAIDNSSELFHINSHHNLKPEEQEPVELDGLFLRVERQFLQRLPKTRGIVFSIRTYITPIREVTKDKEMAKALRTSVDSYGPELAAYKNKPLWNDVLAAHLDEVVGVMK